MCAMPQSPSRNRRERGQSLVELALVLPLLMLVILGAIDFGRVFYASMTVAGAARNGAQYASENPTDTTGIQSAALDDAGSLDPAPTVTVSGPTSDGNGGEYVRVQVDHEFSTLIPWPGLPSSIEISRAVTMRVAQ